MKRRELLKTGTASLVLTGGFGATAFAQDAPAIEIPDMVLGNTEAPVELIEYASFTCPHCKSFHEGIYPQLKADYIDTGNVKFVYREVYFDRFGLWASMIARCFGDERFFAFTDVLYKEQSNWTAGGDPQLVIDNLRRLAKTAGMTDETLDACMSDADMAQALVAWYQENADRDNVSSTPSFVINGTNHRIRTYAELQSILDELIADA